MRPVLLAVALLAGCAAPRTNCSVKVDGGSVVISGCPEASVSVKGGSAIIDSPGAGIHNDLLDRMGPRHIVLPVDHINTPFIFTPNTGARRTITTSPESIECD